MPSVLPDPALQDPGQELPEVASLTVTSSTPHLQRRTRWLQLYAPQPSQPASWDGEHVVAAVGVDGDRVILTQVPTATICADDVPVESPGLQGPRLQTCGDRVGDELVDELLGLRGLPVSSLLRQLQSSQRIRASPLPFIHGRSLPGLSSGVCRGKMG